MYEKEAGALDKDLDDPPFSIIAESDESDDNESVVTTSDIEHFPTESDESVLEERIPTRSVRRSSRLRQHHRLIGRARSRARRQQRVSVDDHGGWEDGSDFEPNDYNFDDSNSGISNDCDVTENSSESDFFKLFFPLAVVELLVRETNRYYHQALGERPPTPYSRTRRWKDTDVDEMYVTNVFRNIIAMLRFENLLELDVCIVPCNHYNHGL